MTNHRRDLEIERRAELRLWMRFRTQADARIEELRRILGDKP